MKKSQVKELDKLFSQLILKRDGGKCVICNTTERLCTHHWYKSKKRGGYATRWTLENGIAICVGCHLDAHLNTGQFILKLETIKGREWMDETVYKIDVTLQSTFKVDYDGVKEFLEGKLKEMEDE